MGVGLERAPARAEDGEAPPARRRQPRRQRRVDPVPGRHQHRQEAPAVKRPQPLTPGFQLGKHGLYWTVAAVFRLLLLRSGMVPVAPAMLEDRARQVGGGLGRNDRKREGRALQSLDQPLQRGRPGLGIVVAPPEIRRFRSSEVEFLRQRLPGVSPHFSPGSWSARCCRAGREGKRAARCGASGMRLDAPCRPDSAALRVAPRHPPAASRASTVGTATLFGPAPCGSNAWTRRRP